MYAGHTVLLVRLLGGLENQFVWKRFGLSI